MSNDIFGPQFQYARPRKSRSKWFSKMIVVGLLAFFIWFVIRVLNIFEATGMEPVALISLVSAVVAGELGLMALIRKWDGKEGK